MRKLVRIAVLTGVAGLAFTDPALARDESRGEEGDASASEYGIDEIIVTAQKREQAANSVGITIAAIGGDDLVTRGVVDTGDLAKVVSGFNATLSPRATPVYTLRGVGLYDATLGAAPSVAVYVDEIPLPYPMTQAGATLDVQRLEVLKGPQGTLFGQSSTGGAINYISAKPTESFEAGFNASFERFGKIDAGGFVSGPLSETLRVRLSARAIEGGAWQYSVSRKNDKNGAANRLFGRLLVDWTPTERLKVGLNFNGWRDKSESTQGQFRSNQLNIVGQAGSINASAIVDPIAFAGLTTPTSPNFDPSFVSRQAVVYGRILGQGFAPGAKIYPTDPARTAAYLGGPLGNGRPLTKSRAAEWTPGLSSASDNSFYQGALRLEYELSDAITVTSLSSFLKTHIDINVDQDGTTANAANNREVGNIKSFSQELRVTGNTGNLNWIIGGNIEHSRISDTYQLLDGTDNSSTEALPGLRYSGVELGINSKVRSYAAFANMDWKLGGLTILGGVRFTQNRLSGNSCARDLAPSVALSKTFGNADVVPGFGFYDLQTAFGLNPANHIILTPGQCYVLNTNVPTSDPRYLRPTVQPYRTSLKQDNVSWRVGANYQTQGGALIYGTVSKGYKAGVLPNMPAATTDQYAPVSEESLLAYEVGIKAPLADRRLQLNVAGFYYDYRDKQLRVRILDPVFGLLERTVNVPKSYVMGAEVEVTARPLAGLVVSGNATYLKSRVNGSFDSFQGRAVYNQEGYTGEFRGSSLPYAPTFSAAMDSEYIFPVKETVAAFVGGSVTYQDRTNATFVNSTLKAPNYVLRSRTLVDLRAGVQANDETWKITVFGRNIFNKNIMR